MNFSFSVIQNYTIYILENYIIHLLDEAIKNLLLINIIFQIQFYLNTNFNIKNLIKSYNYDIIS